MSKYRQTKRLYLLHEKKQKVHQIYKHIYPGGLPWEHSPTYPKQSLKRKIELLRYSVPQRIKCVWLRLQGKWKQLNLNKLKISNIIRILRWHPIFVEEKNSVIDPNLGTNRKFILLGKELSDRLERVGRLYLLGIYREREKPQYLKGNCAICGNPLGHWYREYSFQSPEDIKAAHIMCAEYLTDEKGVLV